jgi:DNA-binding transcriptional MerR regulator
MTRKRQDGPYTSGELASLANVSADTIRHYEKRGLLAKPLRTRGGYRLYPPEAQVRIQTIRCVLRAGFSLSELAEIFKERDSGGTPCRRVASLASQKIEALEAQIVNLTNLRDWLKTTLGGWQQTLAQTAPGRPARLLESIAMQETPAREGTTKGKTNESTHNNVNPLLSSRGASAKRG